MVNVIYKKGKRPNVELNTLSPGDLFKICQSEDIDDDVFILTDAETTIAKQDSTYSCCNITTGIIERFLGSTLVCVLECELVIYE